MKRLSKFEIVSTEYIKNPKSNIYCNNKNCTYRLCEKHFCNIKKGVECSLKDMRYKIGVCRLKGTPPDLYHLLKKKK